MRISRVLFIWSACLLFGASCVTHEVSFEGKSEINPDGSLLRKGQLTVQLSGERDIEKDSLGLSNFFNENYVVPGENRFSRTENYKDSLLTISWQGIFGPDDGPVSDYIHKSADGQMAINRIKVNVKNRWIYKDISYLETFSDPVDTNVYFPLIKEKLSEASGNMLDQKAMKGIPDRARAESLLNGMETTAGMDLFRKILTDPDGFDSLSKLYDESALKIADSLAGFEGVKQSPDSLDKLIRYFFDAAWDSLLTDYPGLFGSFGIDDSDVHNFIVEVSFPGCLISSNADTTIDKTSIWSFSQLDFFAKEFSIELTARKWAWVNVAISVAVIAIIFFGVYFSLKRKR